MRYIGAEEVEARLDDASLVGALRDMFRSGCTVPLRHHHTVPVSTGPEGTLLLMPAWQQDRDIGVKLVTIFPGNADRGLPSVMGVYLLLDGTTGEPRALIDGPMLTLRRTACASALAASYLAREDAATLLMVGTGALAPHLVRAHATVRPIRQVLVWGRRLEKAEALASRLDRPDLRVTAARDLEPAVRAADVVSCATLATEPLILGSWLRPGTHLDLVGGFTPARREADDEAVRRARVYVDTREGALKEAGDIVQPLERGVLQPQDVAGDLFDLTRGACQGRRTAEEITLFKSVGTALEDLAAAMLAVERTGAAP